MKFRERVESISLGLMKDKIRAFFLLERRLDECRIREEKGG